ncbi:hypothetical protein BKA62DRAFT_755821 [Auriculariales sp. MPI-PUGE-AT-0066]|nr:hypothetical protein BKA62DRAFT_755821 [Auriculariales sp. MPI-PUGE-AT-0066]
MKNIISVTSTRDEPIPVCPGRSMEEHHLSVPASLTEPGQYSQRTLYQGNGNRHLWSFMCMAAIGRGNLEEYWGAIMSVELGDDRHWTEINGDLSERYQIIVIAAGLAISSETAFLTTVPPRPTISDYTMPAPYALIFIGLILSCLASCLSACALFFCSRLPPIFIRDVLLGSRPRVLLILMVMSSPCIAVMFGSLFSVLGLFIALFASHGWLIKVVWILAVCTMTAVPVIMLSIVYQPITPSWLAARNRLRLSAPGLPAAALLELCERCGPPQVRDKHCGGIPVGHQTGFTKPR